MIADFVWPKVQDGWLELDGTDINISTYSALYSVMTIQMSGTRIAATATITSLDSTVNMRVGYYVFGTGIASGTTIISIDSNSQITLSSTASSSGTSQIVVSPWLMNTGTIRLPDVSTAGRFRRSRTSSTKVGDLQSSTNLKHTHAVSGTTGTNNVAHSHYYSGSTGSESADHTHTFAAAQGSLVYVGNGSDYPVTAGSPNTQNTSGRSAAHYHSYSGNTGLDSTSHSHSVSFTSGSTGDSETRPSSIVVMTCVKT